LIRPNRRLSGKGAKGVTSLILMEFRPLLDEPQVIKFRLIIIGAKAKSIKFFF
jgi:hypothetical protein